MCIWWLQLAKSRHFTVFYTKPTAKSKKDLYKTTKDTLWCCCAMSYNHCSEQPVTSFLKGMVIVYPVTSHLLPWPLSLLTFFIRKTVVQINSTSCVTTTSSWSCFHFLIRHYTNSIKRLLHNLDYFVGSSSWILSCIFWRQFVQCAIDINHVQHRWQHLETQALRRRRPRLRERLARSSRLAARNDGTVERVEPLTCSHVATKIRRRRRHHHHHHQPIW